VRKTLFSIPLSGLEDKMYVFEDVIKSKVINPGAARKPMITEKRIPATSS